MILSVQLQYTEQGTGLLIQQVFLLQMYLKMF